MKKKKQKIVIGIVILSVILLFPICLRYKDGGSTTYRSIVNIYEVKNWRQLVDVTVGFETLKTGITVKLFGIPVFDNTKNKIITDPSSIIGKKRFPVSMSAEEMLEKAKDEGFVVMEEFSVTNGEENWQQFYETTQKGNPAVIYLADYYTLDKQGVSEEYYEENKDEYPKIFLSSLYFDGKQYTVTERPGYVEQPEMVRTYPHLVKFEGPDSPSALFDRYEYYVLVHDKNVTWKELEWGLFSSQMGDYIDHYRIVSKHIIKE